MVSEVSVNKMSNKLKITLLVGKTIEGLIIAQTLFKNQNDYFEIIGLLNYSRQGSKARKGREVSLTFENKLKILFQAKGIWGTLFYSLVKRWFVSPNSKIRRILIKILPRNWFNYTDLEELAQKFNTPLLTTKDINSYQAKNFLNKLKPDLGIVCLTEIIKDYIFTIPKFGCLNYHNGLLPKYRGSACIFWQLYYKDSIGYTIHEIDRGIDSGSIILKKEISYKKKDNLAKTIIYLKRKMSKDCAKEIVRIISKLKKNGKIESYSQDEKSVSFFRLPSLEQKKELEKRFLK